MDNLAQVEECYKKYCSQIPYYLPEGLNHVNINFLLQLGLLYFHQDSLSNSGTKQCFHVVDSNEKITLINDEFVVWIIPEKINQISSTICLIAINDPLSIKLETGFKTSGVYNSSKLVLKILDKLLLEILENEVCLKKLI